MLDLSTSFIRRYRNGVRRPVPRGLVHGKSPARGRVVPLATLVPDRPHCLGGECAQVVGIVGAATVVSGEQLHHDEVPDRRHRQHQPRQHLDIVGGLDDLGFHSAPHEEQVGHQSRVGTTAHEAHRRQTSQRLLLDDRDHLVPTTAQRIDHMLGVSFVADRQRDIDVTRSSAINELDPRRRRIVDREIRCRAQPDAATVRARSPASVHDASATDGVTIRGTRTVEPP